MFEERLRRIQERVGGTLALSLVGLDGIPVESLTPGAEELDLEAVAVELLTQIRAISDDNRELNVGPVRQFSVTTERYTLMLGSLTDSYFLMLVLDPEGHFGRARFELRRAPLDFERDLI